VRLRSTIQSWTGRLLAPACAVACAATAALASPPQAAALEPCGKQGYSYAGFQSASRGHGVRATLVALDKPDVRNGHVAAWIGVGGRGLGPNGSDQWLQVGLSAFHGTGSNLYYEVTAAGSRPRYHELAADVAPGERQRVAVLEVADRAGWWRVWLNGKPVSKPIHLPGSSGRFEPIATAETWDGGTRVCNRFKYRFDDLAVAGARGGGWRRFVHAHRFEDRGYRVTASRSSFVAAAR
jgi:hypothetical protein